MGAYQAAKIPILMYHQITGRAPDDRYSRMYCVSPSRFRLHMYYLRFARYTFMTVSALAECMSGKREFPPRPIAVTFDDAYSGVYRNAFPVLRTLGVPATVYVVTGCIGATNRWDEAEGHPAAALMDESQIREMSAWGVEFGSHTVTHRRLAEIPLAQAEREIHDSRVHLESLTGRRVRSLSYPYGDASFTNEIRALVEASGYRSACGTDPGCNLPDADILYLSRLFPKSFTGIRRLSELIGSVRADYKTVEDYWR